MFVRRVHHGPWSGGWEWLAPAKVNLFLEVHAKRLDGFHELETLLAPIDWFDTVYFKDDPRGQISLWCEVAAGSHGIGCGGRVSIPEGPDNLVVKAIEALRRRAAPTRGAQLGLVKRIPAAAGLAGGSSDAAAALRAANLAWELHLPDGELADIAAEIGSDLPFFLGPGAAVCRGRGEQVERVATLGQLHLVVVAPPDGLATVDVYRACRPAQTPRPIEPLLDALRQGHWDRAGRLLTNRLQPAAAGLSPWIERAANQLARTDVLGHQMSGSGTSYFGLCRNASHARRLARRLATRGIGRVRAVRTWG